MSSTAAAAGNAAVIERFYAAFSKRDATGMVACYHPDVHFSDPVFPDLRGHEAAAMWIMLCEAGEDLTLEYGAIEASGDSGSAHWDARYTFSTGNKVLNRIDAAFTFKDGRIIRHQDTFDLHKWSGQALGVAGKLLGWTGLMQNTVRKQADKGLRKYIAKNNIGADIIPALDA